MSVLWIIEHMHGLARCIAESKANRIAGHLAESQIVRGVYVRPAEAYSSARVTAVALQEEAVRGCRQE